ncbi:MAG: hypothetical protein J6I84_03745 [Bacilli bacterium]|nr:hypothetical protein [Bacilli bacterium]
MKYKAYFYDVMYKQDPSISFSETICRKIEIRVIFDNVPNNNPLNEFDLNLYILEYHGKKKIHNPIYLFLDSGRPYGIGLIGKNENINYDFFESNVDTLNMLRVIDEGREFKLDENDLRNVYIKCGTWNPNMMNNWDLRDYICKSES